MITASRTEKRGNGSCAVIEDCMGTEGAKEGTASPTWVRYGRKVCFPYTSSGTGTRLIRKQMGEGGTT